MTLQSSRPLDWRICRLLILLPLAIVLLKSIPGESKLPPARPISNFAPLDVPSRLVLGLKLSLNQASAKDLAILPGIGVGRARRIVQWRKKYGPFEQASDLQKVPGIGPKTWQRLAPLVLVGDKELMKSQL